MAQGKQMTELSSTWTKLKFNFFLQPPLSSLLGCLQKSLDSRISLKSAKNSGLQSLILSFRNRLSEKNVFNKLRNINICPRAFRFDHLPQGKANLTTVGGWTGDSVIQWSQVDGPAPSTRWISFLVVLSATPCQACKQPTQWLPPARWDF